MKGTGEEKLKAVFEVVEYLLIAGAVIGVGASVKKYAELITPKYPLSSEIAAVVIMLLGLGLSLWAGFYGIHKLGKVFQLHQWQMYTAIALLFGCWGYIVSAFFFAAVKT